MPPSDQAPAFTVRHTTSSTLVGDPCPSEGETVTVLPADGYVLSSAFLGESSATATMLYRNEQGRCSTLCIDGFCPTGAMFRAIEDWLPARVHSADEAELLGLKQDLDRVEKALAAARDELARRTETTAVPYPSWELPANF